MTDMIKIMVTMVLFACCIYLIKWLDVQYDKLDEQKSHSVQVKDAG